MILLGRPAKPIQAKDKQDAAEQVVKRRSGGHNGTGQASLTKNFKGEPGDIAKAVMSAKSLMEMPKVESDEECRQRISDYFQYCIDTDNLPLWEGLALYLGVVRKTLWEWSNGNGCSRERCNIVRKAKEALASVDAALAQKGKIQPVVYIFRAKNFFDMRDQQDVVITPNNPLGEETDRAQLESKVGDIVVAGEVVQD